MSPLERKLAEFVDRSSQMGRFCEILDTFCRPIMFVHGDGGVGKSSLLARMIHECSVRKLARTQIVWTETRNPDYLAIMRSIRDNLGAEHFSSFTSVVNGYFDNRARLDLTLASSGTISVASNARIEDSHTGDIAGVVIRDCMFVVPRSDLGVSENERMLRLTQQFVDDLAAFTTSRTTVMFFDAVEKMTEETTKWIWGELMPAVRDGRVSNTVCVLLGRTLPQVDRDTRLALEQTPLGPLAVDDIEEYLRKRNIACQAFRELAMMILVATGGHPADVAAKVDAFELELEKMARTKKG